MADFWPTEKPFVLALFNPYVKNQYIKGKNFYTGQLIVGFIRVTLAFHITILQRVRRSDQTQAFC